MKHFLYHIILFMSSIFLLSACQDIAPEDRFIHVGPTQVRRAILLEDFTGQRCIYCPEANAEVNRLQEAYGEENIVAVAIHATALSISETNSVVKGLGNQEGNQYAQQRESNMALPSVYINRRTKTPNNAALGGLVKDALGLPSHMQINMAANIDTQKNEINILTSVYSENALQGRLQLWVIEDSIQSLQLLPKGKADEKYLHRHVFRKAANGINGEEINLAAKQEIYKQHIITTENHWNKKQLMIVAFVETEEGVQQVISRKIK